MITTFTYDRANRLQLANAGGSLTTYTFDAAGNRTGMQSSLDTVYYTWDAAGRMATAEPVAGIVNFTYNADGQRVAKQSTDGSVMGYLYDYKHLLHETDDVGGEITNTYATTTDQEFGDLISEDGDQYYHQYDAQACTNALLDSSGNVQATFKYYAYGQIASSSIDGDAWSTLTVNQWASMTVDQWATLPLDISSAMGAMGQKQYYFDSETQFYLLGSGTNGRYYDANTARFVSEDPVRQAGGSANLFEYVADNPINKLDPSGHDGSSDDEQKKAEERRALERQRESQYHPDNGKTYLPNNSTAQDANAKQESTTNEEPTTKQGAQNQEKDKKDRSQQNHAREAAAEPGGGYDPKTDLLKPVGYRTQKGIRVPIYRPEDVKARDDYHHAHPSFGENFWSAAGREVAHFALHFIPFGSQKERDDASKHIDTVMPSQPGLANTAGSLAGQAAIVLPLLVLGGEGGKGASSGSLTPEGQATTAGAGSPPAGGEGSPSAQAQHLRKPITEGTTSPDEPVVKSTPSTPQETSAPQEKPATLGPPTPKHIKLGPPAPGTPETPGATLEPTGTPTAKRTPPSQQPLGPPAPEPAKLGPPIPDALKEPIHSRYPDGTIIREGEQPGKITGPSPEAEGTPHTVLQRDASGRVYKARQYGEGGVPDKDVDFTTPTYPNGKPRPGHTAPGQHRWIPNDPNNPSAGYKRGPNEPLSD